MTAGVAEPEGAGAGDWESPARVERDKAEEAMTHVRERGVSSMRERSRNFDFQTAVLQVNDGRQLLMVNRNVTGLPCLGQSKDELGA